MNKIEIIVPKGTFGPDEDYLVEAIIRAIADFHSNEEEWGEKYGTNVDNEIFSMNRYCWCDVDGCKLCNGEIPNFHYKPTDFKVWWYKYIGRGMKFNRSTSIQECSKMLSDCLID